MAILEGELKVLGEGGVFNGETAFKLHDTCLLYTSRCV